MKRLVVLISGNGSNLQALIDAIIAGSLEAEIVQVLSNEPEACGLLRAQQAHIPTMVCAHKHFPHKAAFESALKDAILPLKPDYIILAGFMRILSADFVHTFEGQILNIHPSLLPRYPGLHTHAQALADGAKIHGATVHLVTAELDAGPIIAYSTLEVRPEDTPETLGARVLKLEHRLYPAAITGLATGRICPFQVK